MTTANISWVTDRLATGGDLSYDPDMAVKQFTELQTLNLGLVIDMRVEDDDEELWSRTRTEYLRIPTDDVDGYHMPYEAFDEVVATVRVFLEHDPRPVFIHCHMGVHRGPSAALAVLLDQRMPATRAYDLIREKRPQAGLGYALDAMGAHLHRRGVSRSEFNRRMTALDNHIKATMTPRVVRAINTHIKRSHQLDDAALARRGPMG